MYLHCRSRKLRETLIPSCALFTAAVLICAGCTTVPQPLKTYDGPELPAQEVALIAGELRQSSDDPQRLDTGGVYIGCMDGVSLERYFGGYDSGGRWLNTRWPDKLTVIPGLHYLAVVYSFPRGQVASWATVALDVEAGRQYMVRKELTGDVVRMWVEDTSNGRTVARATPMVARPKPGAIKPCP